MKIVLNKRFGGFSLSNAALVRFAHLRGLTLYKYEDDGCVEFYTTPTFEVSSYFSHRLLSRTDPLLIQTIEELGDLANGPCARLAILDIAPGQQYRICDYDGKEYLEFPEEIHWEVAR